MLSLELSILHHRGRSFLSTHCLPIMSFSIACYLWVFMLWLMRIGTTPWPGYSLGTVQSNNFICHITQLLIVSSHAYTDHYPGKYLRDDFCRSPGSSSPVLYLETLAVFFSPRPLVKWPRNSLKAVGLGELWVHVACSPLLWITVLHCLIYSFVKTIFFVNFVHLFCCFMFREVNLISVTTPWSEARVQWL